MAILQRKDLAHEFSLIVQQEIINHNNSMLATNVAIDGFRRDLLDIEEKTLRNIASMQDSLRQYSVCSGEDKDKMIGLVNSTNRGLSDLSKNIDSSLKKINQNLESRFSYFLTIDGFKEFEKKVDQWISSLKALFAVQKDYFAQEIKKSSDCLLGMIENYKDEINIRLNTQKINHQEIESSLDVFAVNFSGHTKEIEACKYRCLVIEKNIEKLYTQIERLKSDQRGGQ